MLVKSCRSSSVTTQGVSCEAFRLFQPSLSHNILWFPNRCWTRTRQKTMDVSRETPEVTTKPKRYDLTDIIVLFTCYCFIVMCLCLLSCLYFLMLCCLYLTNKLHDSAHRVRTPFSHGADQPDRTPRNERREKHNKQATTCTTAPVARELPPGSIIRAQGPGGAAKLREHTHICMYVCM